MLPAAIAGQRHRQRLDLLPRPLRPGGCLGASADLEILAPRSLIQLANHFKGSQVLSRPSSRPCARRRALNRTLRDIKGQESAKRALEVAAAGGHNLLLWGMMDLARSLAQCLPSILPPMSPYGSLDVAKVYSLTGLGGCVGDRRPFRAPTPQEDLVREAKLARSMASCSSMAWRGSLLRPSPGSQGCPHGFRSWPRARPRPSPGSPLRFDAVAEMDPVEVLEKSY